MVEVLIVGNGISRLVYDDLIRTWSGEVWGCNRVFYEYGDCINRLAGHTDAMVEAREHRRANQHEYEIWGGHLGKAEPAEKVFTCPGEFRADTGTTMVAQALHEGRNVAVVGFDLGGPDVISPGIEHQNKFNWVKRWRGLVKKYGHNRVRFIGYNHLPYIMSRKSPEEYAKRYRAGKPHIPTPEYMQAWALSGRPLPYEKKEELMKVRYKKGGAPDCEMPDAIAKKMIAAGKVEEIKPRGKPKDEVKDEKVSRPKTNVDK